MKILVVQDYLRSGGTERQSVLLTNEFAAAGHDATLLTFRPGGALAATVAPAAPHHILQPFDLGLDWFAPGLLRFARRSVYDVILCMGRMANCYAGGLQHRLPATAVVGTMRTGKALPALFRHSLRTVSHVVANSQDARDTLVRQHHVPSDRISVIYNSLVFAPQSALWRNEPLRAQHGATSRTTVLLCVAMFRREKNQRELIEIVAGLPEQLDWQLWLAGDGPERAACEQLVAEKKLGSRVKFLGFLKDPTPLYCAADIAVHASWSEALSNFLIEAQAHGLLAIAYAAQGIGECFLPGRTGWVIPRHDRLAFRDTLTRRISEPAVAHAERSADARNHARTTFDRARQVAAYLELFEKLAHPSASAR
ncbi:MAG: glycosyltransferase [Verrucomicrobia bacterium]|nr:glycosyltransferase [Verrucomicrobiota bacterium]